MNLQKAHSAFDEVPLGFDSIGPKKNALTGFGSTASNVVELPQQGLLELLFESEDSVVRPVVWTDDDIETLREGILREACHVLLDNRAAMATRKDRWKWINDESWSAFSFRACAAASYVNHDELRGSLVSLLRRHKVLQTLQAA